MRVLERTEDWNTFEDWLKAQKVELDNYIEAGGVGELPYIKMLSQALIVQEVINAWNFYEAKKGDVK